MARVKSRNTAPERLFRGALRKARPFFSFICNTKLPGKPDFVIPIRGPPAPCSSIGEFWHGRQWALRKHASLEGQFTQSASRDYWLAKIRRNIARDLTNTAALLDKGWKVARFWESDVTRDPEACVAILSNESEPDARSVVPQRTVAEFFAGIGLMRYAFERQGWRVAFANDIDPKKAAHVSRSFWGWIRKSPTSTPVNPASVPDRQSGNCFFPMYRYIARRRPERSRRTTLFSLLGISGRVEGHGIA